MNGNARNVGVGLIGNGARPPRLSAPWDIIVFGVS
jgi:hypothetical protein